ncbi:Beta-glucuronidase [Exaiptasia diaphana]|nr:Beta-glucuronidase [Exaiptasia diaphana]
MPVPSSFNDITEMRWLKNFVGWVWYERQFYIPMAWSAQVDSLRIVLRFGSVNYYCKVWLNGNEITSHEGGHLPFEVEVTHYLDYSRSNRLTVAVNNTLTRNTIPPGEYQEDQDYIASQKYSFDFFNYAGIHRSVILYTTPPVFLSDISIATDYLYDAGIVKFFASVSNTAGHQVYDRGITMLYELLDHNRRLVTTVGGTGLLEGQLRVTNPSLWWPIGMGYKPAYLYTLQITTITNTTQDVYRLPVGIRSIRLLKTRFLINDAPFYFKGLGKHEDADFRGRGFDLPTLVKDFNLLKWFGANSFRTSHYPYSEETMNLADELGFVVIDECPAVGLSKLEYFNNHTFELHLRIMEELIQRDKNHPSVVMWSVANEPISHYEHVADYLRNPP